MKDEGGPIKSFKNFEQKVMFPFFKTNENNVKLGVKNLFGGENPVVLLQIIVFSQKRWIYIYIYIYIIFLFIAKFG